MLPVGDPEDQPGTGVRCMTERSPSRSRIVICCSWSCSPAIVTRLRKAATFAGFGGKAGVAELAAEVMRFEDEVDPDFALAFQESTFADPIPQGFLDTVIGESLRCPARVWKLALQGQLTSDSVAAARRCRLPAILIRGEHDAFVPHADQLKLRDALGSPRIFTMSGVGHAPQWERPEQTARQLIAFIAEIDGASPRA